MWVRGSVDLRFEFLGHGSFPPFVAVFTISRLFGGDTIRRLNPVLGPVPGGRHGLWRINIEGGTSSGSWKNLPFASERSNGQSPQSDRKWRKRRPKGRWVFTNCDRWAWSVWDRWRGLDRPWEFYDGKSSSFHTERNADSNGPRSSDAQRSCGAAECFLMRSRG